jgi:hypothetical protein
MRQRCENHNSTNYKRYGGIGITVCEQWSDFDAFLKDMGPRPVGHSLERVNNEIGYSPENCIWATPRQQSNNTRKNVRVSWNGETLTIAEWARRAGLCPGTLRKRVIEGGWTMGAAISTPVRPKQNKRKESF